MPVSRTVLCWRTILRLLRKLKAVRVGGGEGGCKLLTAGDHEVS